jgi:GH35 family endo-1,4-beta-xylanase
MSDSTLSHRKGTAALQIFAPDGSPLARQEVEIRHTRHKFLFGASFFDLPYLNGELQGESKALSEIRLGKMQNLFNAVTLPFYWSRFEPEQGKPDTQRLLTAARWLAGHGFRVKGHPLCWHTLCADWLLPMSNAEILHTQLARIDREVTGFKGVIDMWDVINEAVIMPVFEKYDNAMTRVCKELGRIKLIKQVFAAARAANPSAVLLINDFDMSDAYDILVEGCLEAGIQIDVIGLQSHMHQGYWGVEKTLRILDRFSRFNLPIHFTETTLVSGHLMPPEIVDLNDYQVADWPSTPEGEERQSREVLTHYQTLFSHPLVEGITWWDFSDGSWLNAPSGLVRRDFSSKPAYDELLRLVKGEWWSGTQRVFTDDEGRASFSGFLGEYELVYANHSASLSLDGSLAQPIQVRL